MLCPLLYSQFLTVRCELYQICAKNPKVSSIKSFVGIPLQQILIIGGLPAIQGYLSLCLLQLGYATLLEPSQISVEELLMTLFSCNILCRSPTEGIWEVYFNKLSSQAT